jgi:hypothetical protein
MTTQNQIYPTSLKCGEVRSPPVAHKSFKNPNTELQPPIHSYGRYFWSKFLFLSRLTRTCGGEGSRRYQMSELGTRYFFLYSISDIPILQYQYSTSILQYFSKFFSPIRDIRYRYFPQQLCCRVDTKPPF